MLKAYGDLIAPGSYSLHSRFPKVINYTCGEALLSIVDEEIGNGPANAVFIGLPDCESDSCIVVEGNLRLGELVFALHAEMMYDSTLPALTADASALRRNLACLSRIVSQHSPTQSLAFLLDERRESFFVSLFEKAFMDRVREGFRRLKRGDARSGARLIKGTGYGFTPSGDDFIAGYLSGLYLIERFFHEDIKELREAICSESRTGNFVSDSFIRQAMQGHFAERTKALLIALVQGDPPVLEVAAKKVLSIGETSGADFLTGLVSALARQ